MRILHCCLANFYIDNYGYQENILPKIHKIQGHVVSILASTETFINNENLGYVDSGSYYNSDDILVTRVPYSKFLPHKIMVKLRIYKGVRTVLEEFKPDIIFLHDIQFMGVVEIIKYIKSNQNVIIYVDGHADFINSARNWLSKNILHRLVYRWCAKKIEPYTQKFWGVLPARVDFFRDMYGISAEKIELLPLGLDDSTIDLKRRDVVRVAIRNKLNIEENDFVIVSGGKIDEKKNIDKLMAAVRDIDCNAIKLVLFGTPNAKMQNEILELSKHKCIRYVGWVSSEMVSDYFMASDLAFFPGTHSVLWEQAVGIGLPCVFKRWVGIQHVDVGGNCLFINTGSIEEITESILNIYNNKDLYENMKQVATNVASPMFLYSEIAKKSIQYK